MKRKKTLPNFVNGRKSREERRTIYPNCEYNQQKKFDECSKTWSEMISDKKKHWSEERSFTSIRSIFVWKYFFTWSLTNKNDNVSLFTWSFHFLFLSKSDGFDRFSSISWRSIRILTIGPWTEFLCPDCQTKRRRILKRVESRMKRILSKDSFSTEKFIRSFAWTKKIFSSKRNWKEKGFMLKIFRSAKSGADWWGFRIHTSDLEVEKALLSDKNHHPKLVTR